MDKQQVLAFLSSQNIPYEITEHAAVYNMAEAAAIPMPYPEADAKNLLVRDAKREHYYMITVRGDRRVDLKAFRPPIPDPRPVLCHRAGADGTSGPDPWRSHASGPFER